MIMVAMLLEAVKKILIYRQESVSVSDAKM